MPAGWAIAAGAGLGLVGSMLSGSPDDYSGDITKQVNNVSGIGDTLKGLGDTNKSTLDEFVARYAPLFEQQIRASTDNQTKLGGQSDSEWSTYLNKFRPAAEQFASNALGYDTTARRDQAAGDAMATTRTSFDQAGQQLNAGLESAGIDPSSGAAMAQRRQLAAQGAAATASAGNTARKQVEDTGMGYLKDTAGLGQVIAGNSMALGDRAKQAGDAATTQAANLGTLKTLPQTSSAGLYQAAGAQYGNAGNLSLGLQSAATQEWQAKDASTKDWIMGGASAGASAYSGGKK